MKMRLMLLCLCAMTAFGTSCRKEINGDGPTKTETRTATDFTALTVSVPAEVVVTQDPTYKLTIEAQNNILDVITSSVQAKELRIKFKDNKNIGDHEKIVIKVSAPMFNKLTINGAGEITSSNALTGTDLSLKTTGASKIRLLSATMTASLDAYISGSGDIEVLAGQAASGRLTTSGSGNINMIDVTVKKVTASITGAGNIRSDATDELKVKIAGSGSVFYKGTPAIDSEVSGSGSVKKI
ncbi:DUF2807 domain-containing protein [Chitinophaga horti]|uniref:DUF2807 domain-containing protein n=1 Tax=Chitinophaga horti TaxID=2920382 RepID=A0ABY6IX66_9BACT|nr:head GIN domain-containing protein [Chitinophaga horti]UYQ91980.1 DUF2807 domain-containing protein [Chitinophaga horti]